MTRDQALAKIKKRLALTPTSTKRCLFPSGHFWSAGKSGLKECLWCSATEKAIAQTREVAL
jgi:hypothetical protein